MKAFVQVRLDVVRKAAVKRGLTNWRSARNCGQPNIGGFRANDTLATHLWCPFRVRNYFHFFGNPPFWMTLVPHRPRERKAVFLALYSGLHEARCPLANLPSLLPVYLKISRA
jgi:hypothetical protein